MIALRLFITCIFTSCFMLALHSDENQVSLADLGGTIDKSFGSYFHVVYNFECATYAVALEENDLAHEHFMTGINSGKVMLDQDGTEYTSNIDSVRDAISIGGAGAKIAAGSLTNLKAVEQMRIDSLNIEVVLGRLSQAIEENTSFKMLRFAIPHIKDDEIRAKELRSMYNRHECLEILEIE